MTRKMKEFYCVKYLFLWYLKYTERQKFNVTAQRGGKDDKEEEREGGGRRKKRR